jgi:hypothetical protein
MARSYRRTLKRGHCGHTEKYDKQRCARRRRSQVHQAELAALADEDTDFPTFARDGGWEFLKDGKSYWGGMVTVARFSRRARTLQVFTHVDDDLFSVKALAK